MIKQVKAVTWLAGVIFALTGIFAGEALADIAATKHNLSMTGTGVHSDNQTEICIFCHTPHAAIKNNNIPLWNHTLSTVTSYGVYTSPSFDGAGTISDLGNVTEVNATASNLCLSCHDGTVAINSFANPSNANPGTNMVGGSGANFDLMPTGAATNLGNDLTNDHPVNFTFDTALATTDGTLVDPVDAVGSGLAGPKLFNGMVQCASCHDPHTSAESTFLRVSMSSSALCTACHAK